VIVWIGFKLLLKVGVRAFPTPQRVSKLNALRNFSSIYFDGLGHKRLSSLWLIGIFAAIKSKNS
jgi:hypothetical protein